MIDLSHKTQEVIDELNRKLAAQDVQVVIQINLAEMMEDNIDQILELAIVGGLLAIFVLWVFLRNLRLVVAIGVSIPISVYTAFNLFYAAGISINMVHHIARGKNTLYAGRCGIAIESAIYLDIAAIHFEQSVKYPGIGFMTNRYEHALHL